MNGLYLQRHAYMMRIAVPYGLLSSAQMRKLAFITERYDRGLGHWTTRQNLQLNWLRLEDTPDILGHLADVEMHAMQTSGNCVRNITCDPWAGVAIDELFDVRPWCEILRQYTTLHPEFMYLPRKFKIAFSGAKEDRAATQIHDIGIEAMVREDGQFGWRVYVGGGLGRTPRVGQIVREGLPLDELVAYTEAILRVYNLHGRRDNKFKARIKILVGELGLERFTEEGRARVRRHPGVRKTRRPRQGRGHRSPVRGGCPRPRDGAADCAFRRRRRAEAGHRQDLRPLARTQRRAASLAGLPHRDVVAEVPGSCPRRRHHRPALRHRGPHGPLQPGLLCLDLPAEPGAPVRARPDLLALYDDLVQADLGLGNIGTVQDIICCPGMDYCSLANAHSIPIAKQIHERFLDLDEAYDLGPVHIKMSGCINACGHHHVGHIGILGIDKRGQDFYQIAIGGHPGTGPNDPARVGKILGQAVPKDIVVDLIERVLETYKDVRVGTETFIQTVARLGVTPFQEAAYAP
jgi:sulfite reductase (NADPH) hemoprotein beta-component